jgi:dTDP-4-dehydrorhamnose reductase
MKENILITGGSGLLALNWALVIRNDYAVTLCVHNRGINLSNVQTKFLNIESVDEIRYLIEDLEPQCVIHTAGLANVEKCESAPDIAEYLNVQLAKNVAQACAAEKVPLIHISTDHLFKGDEAFKDEEARLSPINVYAKTKAAAEQQVLDMHPNALVIRTNFYGWGTSYRKSFSDMVLNTLRAKKELTLFKDVYYTPIIIEELALTSHKLVAAKAEGIFNIVGDDRVSKYEFGLKLAEEFLLENSLIKCGSIFENKSLVSRPNDMSLSNNKVRSLLNKKIGGVNQHLDQLKAQEASKLNLELQSL